MQRPLHLQTTVLPGGKIVIVDQDSADGETGARCHQAFQTNAVTSRQIGVIDDRTHLHGPRSWRY